MMIKFKGTRWEIDGYIKYLIYRFGAKATIGEIFEKIGGKR
jgi:hypothetical protein